MSKIPTANLELSSGEWQLQTVGLTTTYTISGTPRADVWTSLRQVTSRKIDQRNGRRGTTEEIIDGKVFTVEFQVESTQVKDPREKSPTPRSEIVDSVRVKVKSEAGATPTDVLEASLGILKRYESIDLLGSDSTLSLTYYYESDADSPVQRTRSPIAVIEFFKNNLRARGVAREDFKVATSKLHEIHLRYFEGGTQF